jgi:tripartite-type tricarboxylate transporter receptor subunit TctC
MKLLAHLFAVFAAAVTFGAPAASNAQAYPNRPITLVVPFPAGGPSDALARAIAKPMSQKLGQPILIENAAGAGGVIGTTRVAKAEPDGYTLGFGTIGTHVANVALYKKLPYDPLADFVPVGPAGSAALVLVARATLPAQSLPEFVAWLKKDSKKASYGSAGVGSISHFGCVMLLSALQQEVTHVPYRGVAPAMNDLMGGQVDFMCDQTTTTLPQLAGGRIKAIAVLSDTKVAQLPNVPTAASAGYAVNVHSWNALFLPKGTPAPVATRLTEALAAAMSDPQLRQIMGAVGVELPRPGDVTPAAVTALIKLGLQRDVPALKAKGVYLD